MIQLDDVGAHLDRISGTWTVRFGIYLPGITFDKGYRLQLRIIHESDQFVRGIEPRAFWMNWVKGSELDLWSVQVNVVKDIATEHFGDDGQYLYRYQLISADGDILALSFSDPFASATGLGISSVVTLDTNAQPFVWTDAAFVPPDVDHMVVYELNVREFNEDFDGVVTQLDYIKGLGITVLELMPVSNVKEDVEWGYTPLDYFAPDERLGGPSGLKRLVDAAHQHGIAVVLDSVYAHTHPEFAYNVVYEASGEPNPMLGRFAGEFFSDWAGTDYRKQFTRDYFLCLNQYLLNEFHVDGFRYDYVPGMYDGPMGQGYADLVYQTWQYAKSLARFQSNGQCLLIQCAENLPDPVGILLQSYSNCAWQNGLLDRAFEIAHGGQPGEALAHQLDPEFLKYPGEHTINGETIPVAPFQYFESHDHPRFVNQFGTSQVIDLLGQPFGNRDLYFKVQPYVITLYAAKGIPMLWAGQEFAENWGLPDSGLGRNLLERPLHWEFFYDAAGKALVRLHRIMGSLRGQHRALGSRGYFYYYADPKHLQLGVIAFRRRVDADAHSPAEELMIAINFSHSQSEVWLSFPVTGHWVEQIDGLALPVDVSADGEWLPVSVPSNYGVIFKLS
jgi:1,4-alpha-glucan branching enzyme